MSEAAGPHCEGDGGTLPIPPAPGPLPSPARCYRAVCRAPPPWWAVRVCGSPAACRELQSAARGPPGGRAALAAYAKLQLPGSTVRGGADPPCWRKRRDPGEGAGRGWLRREGGGRGLVRAERTAEAAAGRGGVRGQAGMEPAEGPGELGFHGDEEIIEVVELGPPGPGETGRRAPDRACGGSHGGTGPAPPRRRARPRLLARSLPPGPAASSRVTPPSLRLLCSRSTGRGGVGIVYAPRCAVPRGAPVLLCPQPSALAGPSRLLMCAPLLSADDLADEMEDVDFDDEGAEEPDAEAWETEDDEGVEDGMEAQDDSEVTFSLHSGERGARAAVGIPLRTCSRSGFPQSKGVQQDFARLLSLGCSWDSCHDSGL